MVCNLFLSENLALQMVARRRYNQIKKRRHYDDDLLLDEVMKEHKAVEEQGDTTMWSVAPTLGRHAGHAGSTHVRRGVRISENSRNLGYGQALPEHGGEATVGGIMSVGIVPGAMDTVGEADEKESDGGYTDTTGGGAGGASRSDTEDSIENTAINPGTSAARTPFQGTAAGNGRVAEDSDLQAGASDSGHEAERDAEESEPDSADQANARRPRRDSGTGRRSKASESAGMGNEEDKKGGHGEQRDSRAGRASRGGQAWPGVDGSSYRGNGGGVQWD